ncbi:MAG: oligosaccharide repeat unit polymerase family protein [Methanobrevibacter sp.]|nr:oligosaccharide repeat unit polymerase family protein [Methanobrevibacter sp.]
MSSLYTISTYILKFLTKSFRRSFFFTIIFEICNFFEKQWVNSYLKSLYPNENLLSIVKRNKIIANHIFAPAIVILLFAIFLLLSMSPISLDLQINIAIGFISFLIGSMILPNYFFNNKKVNKENKDNLNNNNKDEENKNILNNKYNLNNNKDEENKNILNNNYNSHKENNNENKKNKNTYLSFIKFNYDDIYSIGFCLILVGVIFFFLSVASVGGIPLIKPSLRYSLKPILTMPVFLMIPGIGLLAASYLNKYKQKLITRSQARFRFILLIAISSFFLFALGYRTPIIAVLLIMIIISYYGEILALWEIIIGAIIGIGVIIGIGYFRSLEEYMITSNTSPLYSLQSRADFTLHVLNLLNYISGDFGLKHGALTLSSIPGSDLGPRMTIGKLIAWRTEVTVTPTLIGPMIVDFGRLGVAIGMGFLGFILGIGYKIIQKTKDSFYIALYAILLTYTILGIETGILDIQVIVYFILGFLVYLANIFAFKKEIEL